MDTANGTGASPGSTATVEVTGKVAGDAPEAAKTPTTLVEEGKPSAAKKTPKGPSKGLDTVDQTAKAWVGSGADADASIKGMGAPSGDALREQVEHDERDNARENIENLASGNSNHNTVAGVNPVTVAQVDRPDYNPQRRPSSRANQMSTMGESPRDMADRVDAKKEGPTNSEIVTERLTTSNEQRDKPLADYASPYMGES